MSEFLRILGVLGLLAGNAFFVAAEYALVAARRGRLRERADRGSNAAARALAMVDDPARYISAIQLALTVFALLLGALGAPLVSDLFGGLPDPVAFVLAFLILAYVSVCLGELIPKAFAVQKADSLALVLAYPLELFARLTAPLVWIVERSAAAFLRLFGVEPAPAGVATYTREDILHSVAAAEDVGVIEQSEEEMLYKVFGFADKEVADVMVPRPEVVAIAIDLPPEEALKVTLDSPYTRYPVYRESLDNIIGVLHVRDLFTALHDRGLSDVDLEGILRPAYMVPETKDLAALLTEFRRTNQHMAVVVDEYGGMEGIVTLEDLLEEIVGEIEDEFDLPDESVEQLDEHTIRIDGTFPIDDFNEQFRVELPQEDFHTVAGFVFGQLGRVPEPGEELQHDGLRFLVEDVDGSRIGRLTVTFEERRELEAAAADEADAQQ